MHQFSSLSQYSALSMYYITPLSRHILPLLIPSISVLRFVATSLSLWLFHLVFILLIFEFVQFFSCFRILAACCSRLSGLFVLRFRFVNPTSVTIEHHWVGFWDLLFHPCDRRLLNSAPLCWDLVILFPSEEELCLPELVSLCFQLRYQAVVLWLLA